jgi:hypothetical protein
VHRALLAAGHGEEAAALATAIPSVAPAERDG